MNEKERANLLRWDGNRKGFYEVYFLKWNDSKSQTAGWLRYTLLSPKKGVAVCELWGIFFDAKDPAGHFAIKQSYPIDRLRWDCNHFLLDLAEASLAQNSCRGELRDRQRDRQLSWELRFDSDGETLSHFPHQRLYQLPIPKTKLLAPHANARFSGSLVANGRKIKLENAPGQQAHLWGTQHALRHAWGHCNTFEEDSSACWEGLDAQVVVGPVKTPPFKLFFLFHEGRWHKFNSPRQLLKNRSYWHLGRWNFEAQNEELLIRGTIEGRLRDFLGVTYHDPDGSLLWCNNSKVASLRLQLFDRSGRPKAQLTSHQGCAAEFVERKVHPQVPIWI